MSGGQDKMVRILIIEDDDAMCEWLESAIQRELAAFLPKIEILETEAEFVLQWLPGFDKGIKLKPDVIVIDIMLRWTNPSPEQPPRPPEVIQGGFLRAGLRCLEKIQNCPDLAKTPLILFTSLTEKDLESMGGRPQGVEFLPKEDGHVLFKKIRDALKSPHS